MQNNPIYLKQLEVGPMENFVYLIGDPVTRQALVVDPAWQIDTILRQAEQDEMNIVGALISHHHYDHTNGIEDLLAAKDCKIYIHKNDAEFVKGIPTINLNKTEHAQEISLGDLKIKLLHTPGHTPGSQCFCVHGHLISGDTLFIGGCGRCDFPGGDAEQMYYTLTQKIMRMDDETIVLPGHHYADRPQAKLGEEKSQNPYLRMAALSLQDFLQLRMGKKKS